LDGDENIKEYLNDEFNTRLKYLCEKINDECAKLIFKNYILRNKDELYSFFNGLFNNKIDNLNFYVFDLSKVNSFIFDNPDIIPIEFNINEPDEESDAASDAKPDAKPDEKSGTASNANPVTSSDAKSNEGPDDESDAKSNEGPDDESDAKSNEGPDDESDAKSGDKSVTAPAKSGDKSDKDSDSNDLKKCKPDSKSDELLQIMKTENVHSYFSLITPSVITPVFEFLSETFNEATSKVEQCNPEKTETPFLCKLFALYSDKSIQFMETVNDDFVKNKDKILDYIERYVFTKHKYTKTLLTDLIKHTFDVKQLLKNDIKKDTITDLNDYFLKLVDLKINETKITDSDIPKFINNFTTETSLFQMINGLLNHQTEDIKNKYKEALKSMFP
jgi:hypothetical protein